MLESGFKRELKREIQKIFGSDNIDFLVTLENSKPDLYILYGNKWAAIETKKTKDASKRPNQEYHVNRLNNNSFARFCNPSNKKEVLDDLEKYFRGS